MCHSRTPTVKVGKPKGVHVTKVMSWDDGFLGARASRPHKAWHGLGHLPHLDQPGMAPWLSFGLADAVPAHRVAACSIALKLSRGQRDRMRAGRPRSQAMPSRRCRGGCGGRLLRKPTCTQTEAATPRAPKTGPGGGDLTALAGTGGENPFRPSREHPVGGPSPACRQRPLRRPRKRFSC